jgi:hypothetical protein
VADEPVIYREDVRGILIALSDIIVELRKITATLRGEDDEEEAE